MKKGLTFLVVFILVFVSVVPIKSKALNTVPEGNSIYIFKIDSGVVRFIYYDDGAYGTIEALPIGWILDDVSLSSINPDYLHIGYYYKVITITAEHYYIVELTPYKFVENNTYQIYDKENVGTQNEIIHFIELETGQRKIYHNNLFAFPNPYYISINNKILDFIGNSSVGSKYQARFEMQFELSLVNSYDYSEFKSSTLGYQEGYLTGWNEGYYNAEKNVEARLYNEWFLQRYTLGFQEGYYEGFNDSLVEHKQIGYDEGYDEGHQKGYNLGISEGNTAWGVLWSGFLSVFGLLNIEIFPGLTIGMIIAVPIVLGILSFIIGVATLSGRRKD